ncbi:MAG: 3-phosphoshikimate 1-carboxyvinyltransferase, partial [Thermoplasmata archaeon]|nr:3-phosphoshikimate 1-carboxyvinyltransferase [Thermoplasmata archaeon]NIY02016.1 3-phosphoshikimate 1-carboxyvinyltransferase [Thermoplasmata archaeon]
ISRGELRARQIEVPGDISSAAFLVAAAAALQGSELLIEDVGINLTRTGFIETLREMG